MSGRKIGNLTRPKPENAESDSIVYKIPCSGPCNKSYIGETGRGLKTRLQEHKRDVRDHNRSNALVLHIEKCQHLPAWGRAEVIEKGMTKSVRKAVEAAHIGLQDTVNERPGFFTWAKSGAKIALQKKIFKKRKVGKRKMRIE